VNMTGVYVHLVFICIIKVMLIIILARAFHLLGDLFFVSILEYRPQFLYLQHK
jgi:hypothetical protein